MILGVILGATGPMLGVTWAPLWELGGLAQLGLRVVLPQGCPGSC